MTGSLFQAQHFTGYLNRCSSFLQLMHGFALCSIRWAKTFQTDGLHVPAQVPSQIHSSSSKDVAVGKKFLLDTVCLSAITTALLLKKKTSHFCNTRESGNINLGEQWKLWCTEHSKFKAIKLETIQYVLMCPCSNQMRKWEWLMSLWRL